ncbi:hypothetical protein FRC06_001599 [Ceratobasidium sp. 370]|nr:hypothetical protein FRC06_001599 [Ceratobasidium sp. 370]
MGRLKLILEVVIPVRGKRARIQAGDGSASTSKTDKMAKRPKRPRQKRGDRVDGFFVSLPIDILTEASLSLHIMKVTSSDASVDPELVLPRRPLGTGTNQQIVSTCAHESVIRLYVAACREQLGRDGPTGVPATYERTCLRRSAFFQELHAIGPQTHGLDLVNYCFLKDARRIDTERANLEASGDVAALEDWECSQYEAMEDRYLHGAKVYNFLRKWEYDEETETIIRDRTGMIRAKSIPDLVLFAREFDEIHHSVYVLWKTLVEQPKPLTQSGAAWKALRPKLKKILDESEYCNLVDRDAQARRMCSERLLELLVEAGSENNQFKAIATALNVGTVPTSVPLASTNRIYELVLAPYPNLNDALRWGCLEGFRYTPFSPHQTEELFGTVTHLVTAEVLKWREKMTVELDQLALTGVLGAKKNENHIKLTVKGSTEPSENLDPAMRRLLRADCIFKASQTHPLQATLRLGSSHPVALPLFFPDLLVTRRDAAWYAAHFEAYPDARRVAKVLLKCLEMEDAAHAEMKVMGSRFVCGRCVNNEKTRDWCGIIGHYMEEQRRQKYARAQSTADTRRHDLGQRTGEALVKVVAAEDAGKSPDFSVFVPPKKATPGIRGYRETIG